MPIATATVTSKGQVTIPAEVRHSLHVQAGDRLSFVALGDGRYELIAATQEVDSLFGMLGQPRHSLTIEQMDEAIAQGATGDDRA